MFLQLLRETIDSKDWTEAWVSKSTDSAHEVDEDSESEPSTSEKPTHTASKDVSKQGHTDIAKLGIL